MKRLYKILMVLTATLAVVVFVGVVRHYQLRSATEAYIAQLKAKGEPMDLAQVLPPSLPPEQNSADIMRQAAALMNKNEYSWISNDVGGMMMVSPGKAMVVWQQPDVRNRTVTNSWKNIGTALDQNKEILTLLRQVVAKPDFDFSINYNAGFVGFTITNKYLTESKQAALELSEAAIYGLNNEDTASAVENLRALLAITHALRNERFVISELVRGAMVSIAVPANWELLQATNLTDQQLAELQTGWAGLDFIQSAKSALAMERAGGLITTAKWRASNADLERSFAFDPKVHEALGFEPETAWDKITMKPRIFLWRYWWSYPDELRQLKGYQVLINSIRMAQTNGSFQEMLENQPKKLDELGITKLNYNPFSDNTDFHSMLSQSVTALSTIIRRVMTMEVAKRTVITAIALKRYQLKHGTYPPDLNSLVPEFLSAVPLDPVDGQPLRYRLNSNGTFLLYSVGPNGKDDGGNPQLEAGVEGSNNYWLNPHALDWVWPQPATAAEIQNYYAHPPK